MLFDYSHTILVVLLGLVFPLFAILNASKTKQLFLESPDKRASFYRQTGMTLLLSCGLVLGSMAIHSENLALIGLSFVAEPLVILGLFASGMIGWWVLYQIPFDLAKKTELESRYEEVSFLLPNSSSAYSWSIVMSFAAGICEEIIFRGFLFWQLIPYFSTIPSMLIVNVIFALSHFSTKWKNMASAFALGILWSLSFLWTGSLWLAMLIHVLVDIYSMTKGYKVHLALTS